MPCGWWIPRASDPLLLSGLTASSCPSSLPGLPDICTQRLPCGADPSDIALLCLSSNRLPSLCRLRFGVCFLFILQIQLCRSTQVRCRPVRQGRLDHSLRCSHGRVGTQDRPFQFPLACVIHRPGPLIRHL